MNTTRLTAQEPSRRATDVAVAILPIDGTCDYAERAVFECIPPALTTQPEGTPGEWSLLEMLEDHAYSTTDQQACEDVSEAELIEITRRVNARLAERFHAE